MPLPFVEPDQHAPEDWGMASANGLAAGKKRRNSALLRMRVRKWRSGGDCSNAGPLPLLDQDLGRLVQTLRALRALAERSVNRVSIAGAATRGAAQIGFPYGIADANVHSAALSTIRCQANANGLQYQARSYRISGNSLP
jgi:hypothetical protein